MISFSTRLLYILGWIVTTVFLVNAVVAVHVPVAPCAFFDAFYRPAASSLVSFALGRYAIGLVRAIVTIHDPVANCRRIIHVRQSRLAVARFFVRPVFAVHCTVATMVRQHHLSYSEKTHQRALILNAIIFIIIFNSVTLNF